MHNKIVQRSLSFIRKFAIQPTKEKWINRDQYYLFKLD